jgi:ADP-ribose pyrophosphatase YjhB (NUDIX family)/adenosine deaminase
LRQISDDQWQQELNSGGEHSLLLTRMPQHWQLSLESAAADRHSILRQALRRHVHVRVDGGILRFAIESAQDAITFPHSSAHCEILLGTAQPFCVHQLQFDPHLRAIAEPYLLSPFETRYLAENGHPHPISDAIATKQSQLVTDLHVHFAGCVRAPHLIRIGLEHGIRYPVALLEEAGIHVEAGADVVLSDLPAELRQALQRSLAIPVDRQITFLEMERIYRLRAPITRNLATFIPLCRQIADDYARMGVKYVELSMSNIVEAARLREVQKYLPKIEAESGVQIRFLAAMSRHDDLEWDLDYIEQMKRVAACRYIAGVDFMGHETNSTRAFADRIEMIARWADAERPGFVIRVHAGENPAYPENVRIALESVGDCKVQLRIGHGLYGVDSKTLAELRRKRAIVEFNLNSNFALNNIQASREIPIRRYLDEGVAAVLGTDGYGIYQSSLQFEARVAALSGLKSDDFALIVETESKYLQQRAASEGKGTSVGFVVPDDPPNVHYTPQVIVRRKTLKEERDRCLLDRLSELKLPLLEGSAIHDLLRGRRCISFAGAWKNSWHTISPESQQRIRDEMGKLIAALDPQKTALITGGTRYGVENVVQELAHARGGFLQLGTLVRETPFDSIQPDSITHACLVGETLYDKAAGLYRLMKEQQGLCLFIGGGNIVSDEIQTACNLRLRYLLMDGPEGASSLHAREQTDRAFKTADHVLTVLEVMRQWSSTHEPYWHLGVNPTVDMVLTRKSPRTQALEVLLIQRHPDASTEPGKWAFPGGFQLTDAPRGTQWRTGRETPREACLRELREETGLDLSALREKMTHVGDFEGGGRDPRDTPQAWSRSTVFALRLPDEMAMLPIAGGDDASDAKWIPLDPLPQNLAFDHMRILLKALSLSPAC